MHRPIFPSGWSKLPITPPSLTLANTLPVGQSFLWHRRALPDSGPDQPIEEFSRVVNNPPRVLLLRQSPSHIHYTAVYPDPAATAEDLSTGRSQKWLEDYFHLTKYPDLKLMYKDWRERDPGLFGKVELDSRAIGVRVLNQDPWECLVAFITSTNNHIPRISSLMHKLSYHFSPALLTLSDSTGSTTYHPFPAPHLWPEASELILRELGFGYRAAFLESSLATLRSEFGTAPGAIEAGLDDWRHMELDITREKLISLKGVGRKVADCVMLMCLDQPSVIPIDTHVGAIAARHPSFPLRLRNKPMSKQVYEEIQSFLEGIWGPWGGWTQAVMFAADLPKRDANLKVAVKVDTSRSKGKSKRLEELPVTTFKRTRSATRIDLGIASVSVKVEAAVKPPLE